MCFDFIFADTVEPEDFWAIKSWLFTAFSISFCFSMTSCSPFWYLNYIFGYFELVIVMLLPKLNWKTCFETTSLRSKSLPSTIELLSLTIDGSYLVARLYVAALAFMSWSKDWLLLLSPMLLWCYVDTPCAGNPDYCEFLLLMSTSEFKVGFLVSATIVLLAFIILVLDLGDWIFIKWSMNSFLTLIVSSFEVWPIVFMPLF
jgi:hypothetical protein